MARLSHCGAPSPVQNIRPRTCCASTSPCLAAFISPRASPSSVSASCMSVNASDEAARDMLVRKDSDRPTAGPISPAHTIHNIRFNKDSEVRRLHACCWWDSRFPPLSDRLRPNLLRTPCRAASVAAVRARRVEQRTTSRAAARHRVKLIGLAGEECSRVWFELRVQRLVAFHSSSLPRRARVRRTHSPTCTWHSPRCSRAVKTLQGHVIFTVPRSLFFGSYVFRSTAHPGSEYRGLDRGQHILRCGTRPHEHRLWKSR